MAARWGRRLVRSMLGIVGGMAVLALAYVLLLRPWHLHWGATVAETRRPMPGDSLFPGASLVTTRAITIRARPEQIWPWLVQMGPGRGGWYSYDRLDNGGRPSADHIVPAWQVELRPGNSLGVGSGPKFRIMEVEPNHHLVLGPQVAWTFALYPQPDGTTRLVERLRARYHWTSIRGVAFAAALDVGDFVMMRKQLLTLRERIEAQAGS